MRVNIILLIIAIGIAVLLGFLVKSFCSSTENVCEIGITSGLSSSNPTGDTGLKRGKTYTVYDNAGNSGTCSVSVTAQRQKRTKSC